MLGLFYLAWSCISHVGYSIKELLYNSSASITDNGTYYSYDGKERDANTNNVVTWGIDSNGDEVLWDRPGHAYRNLSKEKVRREYTNAKKNLSGNNKGITVFETGQRRKITYKDEKQQNKYAFAMIFKDLETGTEYATRYVNVWYKDIKGEEMEFYVKASNPYCLVRITDTQRKIEETKARNGKYSWIKYPDDEKLFVKEFNDEPVTLCGKKSSLFTFSR